MRHLPAAIACLSLACGRPNVVANCGTDGYGNGRCDFTNDGTATGRMCAALRVTDTRGLGQPIVSDKVCSGDVAPRATVSVQFHLDGVGRLCEPSAADREDGVRKPWDVYCDVVVVPYRERL